MTTIFTKGTTNNIMAGAVALATLAGTIVAPKLYGISDIKEVNSVQDTKILHLEEAVKKFSERFDIVDNKMNTAAIESAKAYQLLHDLSEDRFQYNPRPSEIKAESKALQAIASSTQ